MQEVVRTIGAPYEARAHRIGALVNVIAPPVVPEVELRSPMRIEIVGERAAESLGHIGYLEGSGAAGVPAGCRDRAARMQPLIPHKQIIFWIRVALRKRTIRDE